MAHSHNQRPPYLESHPHFSSGAAWDIRSWSRSTELYIKCCIERSRTTRLDIYLDFSYLHTTTRQLIEKLRYELLENNMDTDMACLPDRAIAIIEHLRGAHMEVVQRWESLVIYARSPGAFLRWLGPDWDRRNRVLSFDRRAVDRGITGERTCLLHKGPLMPSISSTLSYAVDHSSPNNANANENAANLPPAAVAKDRFIQSGSKIHSGKSRKKSKL